MTTSTCNDLADYRWLTGDEAARWLAELSADSAPLHTAIGRLRAKLSLARTHLVVEQVELRRRATAKFRHADRMFFTRIGLEQATDEWVAAYKASRVAEFLRTSDCESSARRPTSLSRFGEMRPLADLCCGIGGDLLGLARQCQVIGVDRNPVAAHFASANVRAISNGDAEVVTADAADIDFDGIAAWHIDPDRRPAGRRTTSVICSSPGNVTIERLLERVPHGAVKLAPAARLPEEWASCCEREWISRNGECRQQVAWHGELVRAPGRHRATVLKPAAPHGGDDCVDPAVEPRRTLLGQPDQPIPIASQPNRFVYDVDAAVAAARLTGVLAAEHGLDALSAGPTYLTGSAHIRDMALASFEVVEVLPLRARILAQHLAARCVGHVEIKKRGVDVDPEELRRKLKLRGDNGVTLLLAQIARRPAAILAQRV